MSQVFPVQDPTSVTPRPRARVWTLALGSIGVVYGDIGTSPLYALKESLTAATAGGQLTENMVIGVMSLMLWTLTIIVTLKYVWLIMSADNQGEGGTLSLMALLQRAMGRNLFCFSLLGMAGAALFYGDAIITPAISVLSAVEGLKLVAPAFDPFILPLSMIIIIALFFLQSRGTAKVAAWFGPTMMIWFFVMALGGVIHVADNLSILADGSARNCRYHYCEPSCHQRSILIDPPVDATWTLASHGNAPNFRNRERPNLHSPYKLSAA